MLRWKVASLDITNDRLSYIEKGMKETAGSFLMPKYDHINTLIPYLIISGSEAELEIMGSNNIVLTLYTDLAPMFIKNEFKNELTRAYRRRVS
jgi:hypothetical protein